MKIMLALERVRRETLFLEVQWTEGMPVDEPSVTECAKRQAENLGDAGDWLPTAEPWEVTVRAVGVRR